MAFGPNDHYAKWPAPEKCINDDNNADKFMLLCRKPAAARNALKLGGKNRDADTFVDQLKSEGEKVVANPTPAAVSSVAKVKPVSDVPMDE